MKGVLYRNLQIELGKKERDNAPPGAVRCRKPVQCHNPSVFRTCEKYVACHSNGRHCTGFQSRSSSSSTPHPLIECGRFAKGGGGGV